MLRYTGTTYGKVYIKQRHGEIKQRYTIQIREGNCLAVFIHVRKATAEELAEEIMTREQVLRIVDEAALECQSELAEVREERERKTFESILFWTARAQSEDYAIAKMRKRLRKKLGVVE